MYYIVYKTINLVNNKFYIGKHRQTIDPHQFDGYYGSGTQIQRAIKKYGKHNHFGINNSVVRGSGIPNYSNAYRSNQHEYLFT